MSSPTWVFAADSVRSRHFHCELGVLPGRQLPLRCCNAFLLAQVEKTRHHADQAMVHNPVLFPLWAGSLLWLVVAQRARPYRFLDIAFIVIFTAFVVLKGKNYYVSPAYPMLFAAGAVAFEFD